MNIIQNFSSRKHIKQLPITDILIGYNGIKQLKYFNNHLKLYCEEKDISFLDQGGLLKFYDEVDTTFLTNFKSSINDLNFWSVRKLECMKHEFEVSTEPFVYMDTDIIINTDLDYTGDILVGGPEDNRSKVYLNGAHFSFPEGYILEDGLKDTQAGLNCGILAFKSKDTFEYYLEEYYKFTLNNPCILSGINLADRDQRNSGACTAEQRILKGICLKLNLNVEAVMDDVGLGYCSEGIHYFILRHAGRSLSEEFTYGVLRKEILRTLNFQTKALLESLDEEGKAIFLKIPEFKNLITADVALTKYI